MAEKKKSKIVTLEKYIESFDELINILDVEIEKLQKTREPGSRKFRKIRKNLLKLQKQAPRVRRSVRAYDPNRVSGFDVKCNISKELASFLKVSPSEKLSRNEITSALSAYIHLKPDEKRDNILRWKHLNVNGTRNLQDPNKKSIIIPDKKLGNLLKYDSYIQDVKNGKITQKKRDKKTLIQYPVQVTDPSLKYSVLQKLISPHIISSRV